MLRKLLFIAPFLHLVGCAGVQSTYNGYQDAQEMKYVNQAKIACGRFGFTPGTDAFANCVDKNVNAEKDRDALKAAAFHSEPKK